MSPSSRLGSAAWCLGFAIAVVGAAPQPQTSTATQPIKPTVDNMTMYGTGCPIGSGGMVREMRNNTPVFLFPDWSLSLSAPDANGSVSKFCMEEITLGNAPAGQQVRLANVQVGGWADLELGSVIGVDVELRLGGGDAGSGSATVAKGSLKDNIFQTSLTLKPEAWSGCVDSSGKVPLIQIRTSITLNGTTAEDGKFSGGTIGGEKNELKKALTLHFEPEWRACS